MGLKITTKIDNYDYPDSERSIAYYGSHTVDIKPYIMSFFLRTIGNYKPIDLEEFVSSIIKMLDDCIQEHHEEFPTYEEVSLFKSHLKSQLVTKMFEMMGSIQAKA